MASAALKALPGTFKAWATPRWATVVKYGKVELMPPSPGEIPEAFSRGFQLIKSASTFQWRHLTVRQAWLNTLVATEVICWFFVGECIGKRSLVGYQV